MNGSTAKKVTIAYDVPEPDEFDTALEDLLRGEEGGSRGSNDEAPPSV